jgi:uncharacterized membrane protein
MSAESGPLPQHINQNIDGIVAFHQREQEKLGRTERGFEHAAALIGRPAYLIGLLALAILWIAGNAVAPALRFAAPDPPPFAYLQGLLTLAALATTTIVLMTQQRQGRLESHRAHLDLQVNLLTEQKVTKLIHLLEELRRDLPMVRDRVDAEATALQRPTDAAQVLSALEEVGVGVGVGVIAGVESAAAGGAQVLP